MCTGFRKEGVNFLSSWYDAWIAYFRFLTKTALIMQIYAQLIKEPLPYKKDTCRYGVCFPNKSLNIIKPYFSGNGWTLLMQRDDLILYFTLLVRTHFSIFIKLSLSKPMNFLAFTLPILSPISWSEWGSGCMGFGFLTALSEKYVWIMKSNQSEALKYCLLASS